MEPPMKTACNFTGCFVWSLPRKPRPGNLYRCICAGSWFCLRIRRKYLLLHPPAFLLQFLGNHRPAVPDEYFGVHVFIRDLLHVYFSGCGNSSVYLRTEETAPGKKIILKTASGSQSVSSFLHLFRWRFLNSSGYGKAS